MMQGTLTDIPGQGFIASRYVSQDWNPGNVNSRSHILSHNEKEKKAKCQQLSLGFQKPQSNPSKIKFKKSRNKIDT
jgi:hypothetical protein